MKVRPSVPSLALAARKTPTEQLLYACVARWEETLVPGPTLTQQLWFCQLVSQVLIELLGRRG